MKKELNIAAILKDKPQGTKLYDFLYISYYRNDNTTKLFVKGLTLLSNIKYVHQLQHLLFGLGLSMDLKV